MNNLLIFRNRWIVFLHDLTWVPLCAFLAFYLRFNLGDMPPASVEAIELLILIALPVQAATFWYFGLYRGIWHFASIPDLVRILKGVLTGILLTLLVMFIWQRLEGVPRSVLIMYPVILSLGLAAPRLFYRGLKDRHLNFKAYERKRALLVGAGRAGELLARDLLKSGSMSWSDFLMMP